LVWARPGRGAGLVGRTDMDKAEAKEKTGAAGQVEG
jgi:hypothetical protein